MEATNFNFKGEGNFPLVGYQWLTEKAKANILIIHGMSEHMARYNHLATFLNNNDYNVYGSDIRGHGKTAEKIENVGLLAMNDGWNKVVKDQLALEKKIIADNNLPILVLGHSMGSFIARSLAMESTTSSKAFLFSSTAGHPGFIGTAGKYLSKVNAAIMGKKNRSNLLTKLAFGDFNKKFEKRTEKDWLSRDNEVVDKYIADPFCMQVFTSQFFNDLTIGVLKVNDKKNYSKMKDVPYYLFAGDKDPVGDYGQGPKDVTNALKNEDRNATLKMYKDGRHEMLNETNKDEVYADLLNWISKLKF